MFNFKFKIKMSSFHTEMIQLAFSRCLGLKDSLIKSIKEEDALLRDSCLESLVRHTGFRLSFLSDNLYEIVLL